MLTRRTVLSGLATSAIGRLGKAANWPTKNVTLLHGFAAGGGADTTARLVAAALSEALGQQVVVQTKPGAGTTLASADFAKAAPDGYTLLIVTGSYAASAAFYKHLPYRPLQDIRCISLLNEAPYVISNSASQDIPTFARLLAFAKNGRVFTYGTPGVGSGNHLIIEQIGQLTGVKFQHVPFKGGAQAVIEVVANRIDFMIDPPLSMMEQINAGKMRPIAVTTSQRFHGLPNTPTVAESGVPGFEATGWYGLAAPAGTPDEIIQKLQKAVVSILSNQALALKFSELGAEAKASSPEQLAARLAEDVARYQHIIDQAGIERI